MKPAMVPLVIGLLASTALCQSTGQAQNDPSTNAAGARDATRATAKSAGPRISASLALDMPIIRVNFREMPFGEVIDKLAAATGVNIAVRWQQLALVDVDADKPITLVAGNLRLSQVLWMVLNEAGGSRGGGDKLAYRADRYLILISLASDLGEALITKAYDVTDLIATQRRGGSIFAGRVSDIPLISGVAVAPGAAGVVAGPERSLSGVAVSVDGGGGDDFDEGGEPGPERYMRELVNVVTASVEPDSWDVNGGRGTIRAWRGRIIVRNTLAVHQQLAGALRDR